MVPLNPYMNFDYNLFNQIDKRVIRAANNNLVRFADKLAVFLKDSPEITDGVNLEIALARDKPTDFYIAPNFRKQDMVIVAPVSHYGTECNKEMPVVYTAISKHLFYYRAIISKFVLEQGCAPLNPFMLFDYFILDGAERKSIYAANNKIVERAHELWIFGQVSDGVLDEIRIAKTKNKPVRYFDVINSAEIKEIPKEEVKFEEDLVKFAHEL